jgi:predicted AAA+ superfamily ATPase
MLDWNLQRPALDFKKKASFEKPLQETIHQKLVQHFKRFLVLGGMPEVVANYVEHKDFIRCGQILDDLISSLKTDFAKYKRHVPFLRIAEVFDSIIRQSGGKFMYSKAAVESSYK